MRGSFDRPDCQRFVHCQNRVPTANGQRRSNRFFELAEATDGFHLATVQTQDELAVKPQRFHVPVVCDWKGERKRQGSSCAPGHYTHERNNIPVRDVTGKRGPGHEATDLATFADHDLDEERYSTSDLGAQIAPIDRLEYNEGAGRPDIDDVEAPQLIRQDGRTKAPVATDVDAFQERNGGHGR